MIFFENKCDLHDEMNAAQLLHNAQSIEVCDSSFTRFYVQ